MRGVTRPSQTVTGDRDVDHAFRQHRRALEEISEHPSMGGQYLTNAQGTYDIVLTNGATNKLFHRLGKKLTGWRIMDLRGASATGRIIRIVNDDTKDLWLDVQGWGANITVRIWVE